MTGQEEGVDVQLDYNVHSPLETTSRLPVYMLQQQRLFASAPAAVSGWIMTGAQAGASLVQQSAAPQLPTANNTVVWSVLLLTNTPPSISPLSNSSVPSQVSDSGGGVACREHIHVCVQRVCPPRRRLLSQ